MRSRGFPESFNDEIYIEEIRLGDKQVVEQDPVLSVG